MIRPITNQLDESIQTILKHAECGIHTLTCTIYSSADPDISIEIDFIRALEIQQVFTSDYSDDIELIVRIHPLKYMKLIDHHQDLIAMLKYTYVTPHDFEPIIDILPVIKKYKCIIKNTVDLTKQYHLSQLKPLEDETEYEGHSAVHLDAVIQLIEEDVYTLRQTQVNVILHNLTVKQAIVYIANLFGVTQLNVDEPDNVYVYEHIIITPPQDFLGVFDYLQSKYGVYSKGLEYFYTQGTLYIYPPYETDPEGKSTVHIYNVPSGSYSGLYGYHILQEEDIYIVSNTKSASKNLVELGIENTGNSGMFMRADTLIDGYRTVSNGKGTVIHESNIVTCDMLTERGMDKTALVSKYTDPAINIYAKYSKLAKNDATLVALGWTHCKPFLITPGHKIKYHYDDSDRYNYKTGRCECITYTLQQITRMGETIYTCNASLILRTDPS